jgi:dipeptidase
MQSFVRRFVGYFDTNTLVFLIIHSPLPLSGTPYDMTRGLAGGPYGDPSRFDMGGNRAVYASEAPDSEDPDILAADAVDDAEVFSGKFERAISIFRCAYSWVGHARPQVDGRFGVVWFGQYAPHASGASAIYAGVGEVPSVYGVGSLYQASLDASYWVHAVLGNWCNRFFVHTIGDIKAKQDELESSAFTAHVRKHLCVYE